MFARVMIMQSIIMDPIVSDEQNLISLKVGEKRIWIWALSILNLIISEIQQHESDSVRWSLRDEVVITLKGRTNMIQNLSTTYYKILKTYMQTTPPVATGHLGWRNRIWTIPIYPMSLRSPTDGFEYYNIRPDMMIYTIITVLLRSHLNHFLYFCNVNRYLYYSYFVSNLQRLTLIIPKCYNAFRKTN